MKKIVTSISFFLITATLLAQNVGIGTSNPATSLHVQSTLAEVLRIQGPQGYMTFYDNTTYKGYVQAYAGGLSIGSSPGNDLRLYTNGGFERISILANGNVGILKTNPSYTLDVAGDINFSGLLRINGGTGTSGKVITSNGTIAPAWVSPSNSIYTTARLLSLQSNQILHDGNAIDVPGLSYTFTLTENTVIQISEKLTYSTTGCVLCTENLVSNYIIIDGNAFTSFTTQGDNKIFTSGGTIIAQLGPGTHTIKAQAVNTVSSGDVTVWGISAGGINRSDMSLLFFPQ